MPKLISVEGDGHFCHRPSSNWETHDTIPPELRLTNKIQVTKLIGIRISLGLPLWSVLSGVY